jgi:hypothetical protein
MFDLVLVPAIEKTLREPIEQSQSPVGLLQQDGAAVGTDRSTVEACRHSASTVALKLER